VFTEIRYRDFRQQFPGFVPGVVLIVAVLIAIDLVLAERRSEYSRQIQTLSASMSADQRQRVEALAARGGEQEKLKLELVRREAKFGKELHLAVDQDSSVMYVMQEGAVLRRIPVRLGTEHRLRSRKDSVAAGFVRGAFAVDRVLGPADAWPVPRWVYSDRRLAAPADSMVAGALGPVAVLLLGGTVIYSPPLTGPLRDTAYILPGAIRASAEDLRAVLPNLTPGTPVYVY
jgi:hypothetical protein